MNGKEYSLLFFGFGHQNLPYTRISHEILKELNLRGSCTSAFFVKTENTVHIDNCITKVTCPKISDSKTITYLFYSFFAFWFVLTQYFKNRKIRFIVPTTPPVILPVMLLMAKAITFGGVKWIYHIQDIHPEISFVGKSKGIFYRLLLAIDKCFLKFSASNIALSEEMKCSLIARGGVDSQKISVANNFVEKTEESEFTFDFIQQDRNENNVIYIFSGNIGRFQKVSEIVAQFLVLKDESSVLYLLGDGDELPKIQEMVDQHPNKSRIRILGRKSFNEANLITSQCDYGIVSLAPDITRFAYPSKFGTYLSLGVKVLAFVEQDSQIASEINEFNLGVNTEVSLLQHTLDSCGMVSPGERVTLKKEALKLFGKQRLVAENCDVIERVYGS